MESKSLSEPKVLVVVGLSSLFAALFMALAALGGSSERLVHEVIVGPNVVDAVASLFNIDLSRSYSDAVLTVISSFNGTVYVSLTSMSGIYDAVLEPGGSVRFEVYNLLSALTIKPLEEGVNGSARLVLELTAVDRPWAWLSIPAFILLIFGTLALSMGIVGLWLEAPLAEILRKRGSTK